MRRHGSPQTLEAIRLQAVALHEQGLLLDEIAELLDRSQRAVEKWIKIARDQGLDALRAKPHAGAAPKLDAAQRADLRRRIIAGARAAGFDTDLWTCPRVRQLIEQVYGVTYHVDYLPCLLRTLGFSCQKPQLQARERDEEAVRHWVARDWPRIKKRRGAAGPIWPSSTKAGCC
jgi:transposase